MTVESLLKTISEGMTVNVKDCYGNMIIRFKLIDLLTNYLVQIAKVFEWSSDFV